MSTALQHPRSVSALRERIAEGLFIAPALVLTLVVFVGTMVWTVGLSFTSSRALPIGHGVGTAQYVRLWHNARWIASVENLAAYALAYVLLSLVAGVLLAVLLDHQRRFENAWRTIFFYPYAVSMIVAGLVWQWLLNPAVGLQSLFGGEGFAWLSNPRLAIYAVALAGAWQSAGLVMVIVLAALKGIDPEIRRAAALDGIPAWRTYVSLLLPQVRGAIVAATLLLAMAAARVYDLVVAMTNGGPGNATELPAKFVMAYLFVRQNVGLASAAATLMLLAVAVLIAVAWAARRAMAR
ncbi:MAG TPA: sugar ABC transporter permease [Burkholderiaceae bacterium]